MGRSHRTRTAFIALAIGLGAPLPLAAQTQTAQGQTAQAQSGQRSAGAIEEIVVTARKREESTFDVPVAVSAFSETKIDREGIKNLGDVAKLTPGLEFNKGATPGDFRPSLRGVALIEGRSNVAILVDGVDITGISLDDSFGGAGSQLVPGLLDLERVEVIRGPQSVYFGRSAFSGAIQFVTKEPGDTFEGKVNAGIGNRGYWEASAHLGGPVVADKLAVKLSATASNFDGYYRNPGNNLKLGREQTRGLAAQAVFTPTEKIKIKGQLQYIEQDNGHPAGYVIQRGITTVTGVNRLGRSIFQESRIGISTVIPYKGAESTITRGVLNVEWDVSDAFTFSATTGLNQNDGVNEFDFDLRPQNTPQLVPAGPGVFNCLPLVCVGIFDYDIWLNQFSQEARVRYDNGGALRVMVGGYYFDEAYKQTEYNRFIGSRAFVGATRENIVPRPYRQDTTTESVFGSVEYDFTPQITGTAEVRYNHEKIIGQAPTFVDLTQTGSPVITFRGTSKFNSVNPRFALNYKPNDDISFYASAARGTKPGGLNLSLVVDRLRAYDQESIWTYEAGSKGQLLDGRVQYSGAVYYSDWKNVQVINACFGSAVPFGPEPECPLSAASNLNYIINAKKAEAYGLELEAAANVTDWLSVNAAYSYTESKFKDFVARDVFPAPSTPANRQFAPNKLPLVPKHTIVASVRVSQPLTDAIGGYVEFGGRYTSAKWARFDNRVLIKGKATFNVRVGFEGEMWDVTVFGDNIFNNLTPDYTRYFPQINPFSQNGEFIGAPDKSRWGVRGSVKF
jgi:outer membrane receptor protein involved in Fe transport